MQKKHVTQNMKRDEKSALNVNNDVKRVDKCGQYMWTIVPGTLKRFFPAICTGFGHFTTKTSW